MQYKAMDTVQCFCCKGHGHFVSQCPKKFCNYCKKEGHVIKECRIRPPRRNETAFTATDSSSTTHVCRDQNPLAPVPTLTPEIVQQMIVSAFFALGLSGKASLPNSPWYFDSGTSNHMTNNVAALTNVTNYSGNLQIHTADGNNLPITAIGDISSSFTNVYVSPDLTSNLISVGQLVDNDCKVEFSKSGCLMQDQHSGKMIAKGPKVGRLFPLYSSLSPCFFLPFISCNSTTDNF